MYTFSGSAAVIILFYLNWRLTLSISAILTVFLAMMIVGFRRLRPIFRARQKISAEVSGRLGEALGGIRVVKAFTSEKEEDRTFEDGAQRLFENVRQSITGVTFFSSLSTVVIGCIGVVMILVGGGAIIRGEMTLGDLVMYLAFTALLAGPLIQMTAIGTQLGEAFAGLDRIREVLAQDREDEGESGKSEIGRIQGRVEFKSVSFAYETGQPVLKDVSFDVEPGATIALVGSSGSGKTTLVGLILRFHRPSDGEIYIDGKNVDSVSISSVREQVGVVLQETFLFDGTIEENIRYVDFQQTRVEVDKRFIDGGNELHSRGNLFAFQAQPKRQPARHVRHDTDSQPLLDKPDHGREVLDLVTPSLVILCLRKMRKQQTVGSTAWAQHYHRHVGKRLPLHRAARCQRVIGAACHHEVVLHHRRNVQTGIRFIGSHIDRELGLSSSHVLGDFLLGIVEYPHADIWITFAKAPDRLWQNIGGNRNQAGNCYATAADVDQVLKVGHRLLELSD